MSNIMAFMGYWLGKFSVKCYKMQKSTNKTLSNYQQITAIEWKTYD